MPVCIFKNFLELSNDLAKDVKLLCNVHIIISIRDLCNKFIKTTERKIIRNRRVYPGYK